MASNLVGEVSNLVIVIFIASVSSVNEIARKISLSHLVSRDPFNTI